MPSQKEILRGKSPIQRADFVLSSLTTGGLLPPEVYKQFIRVAQNATPILQAARVVGMKSFQTKIPKIAFTGRVMVAGTAEGTEVAGADRKAPATSEVALNAKKISGMVKVSYESLEDNVEEESFETTIMELIAQQFGIDLEELMLNGDTASGDTYLAMLDGWLKKITSNIVNAGNAEVSKAIFQSAIKSVPLKFRQRAQGKMKFYTSDHAAETWREIIGDRATPAGDKYTLEGDVPPASGRPVVAAANIPVTAGSPDTSPMLLTDPMNLICGVYRQMRIRVIDWPKEEAVYFQISARVAAAVEQEDAAAKVTNLKAE
jgi:HK97 family phage major capsid protein